MEVQLARNIARPRDVRPAVPNEDADMQIVRTSDTQILTETARQRIGHFIRECVNPGAEERDAAGTDVPPELIRHARDVGLFTYPLPREPGGEGADLFAWGTL